MTATILLLIVIFAIILSVFAIYFYDKKLMKEIAEYEERMKNKKKKIMNLKTMSV